MIQGSPASFGAFILGCAGHRLTPQEGQFFAQAQPIGFILFARNLDSAEQIRALCGDLREAVGWNAPIFIDQEGGRVQRLRAPLVQEWLPVLDEVERFGTQADRALSLRFRLISSELLALGIDGNCVPALDLARPDTHPILRNRLLGSDPAEVARLGRVVCEACLSCGVLPVIKHMPGLGRATLDSHLELPRTKASPDTLSADFAPFKALSDMPLGMSAHVVFEALDDKPATISGTLVHRIRSEIGFSGLLMTDDISMQALSGTIAERGHAARDAGCDAVLHCNGDLDEMKALFDAVGVLDSTGQKRAVVALSRRKPPVSLDIKALEAEFSDLENRFARNRDLTV